MVNSFERVIQYESAERGVLKIALEVRCSIRREVGFIRDTKHTKRFYKSIDSRWD